MPHSRDTNTDAGGSPVDGERLDLGDDLEDSFDIISRFGDFSDVRNDGTTDSGPEPENELFSENKNDNSLREQAVEDTEIIKNKTKDGAPVSTRDRVVPIVMWLLFGSAAIIGSKTAIDAVGPAAGPIWEFRQSVSSQVWVPLVDLGQDLLTAGAPLLEHNIILTVVLAVAGFLILRNRRL